MLARAAAAAAAATSERHSSATRVALEREISDTQQCTVTGKTARH